MNLPDGLLASIPQIAPDSGPNLRRIGVPGKPELVPRVLDDVMRW